MPDQTKWQKIEDALKGVYGRIKVSADGYEVTFVKMLESQRLVTVAYVDGAIKGEWYQAKDGKPIHPQSRFWCEKRRRLYPLSKYNALKKAFGKKEADQMTALKTLCFAPIWTSPRSLISHLKKNFPDLEVLEATHA
jgi:hypothetical protein